MTAITFSRIGDVALLTLDRPQALNAISSRTIADLNAALDAVANDDSVALVLTGTGRAFCAGADLREPLIDPQSRVAAMHALVLRLAEYPKVSVAAINGLAYGGGLELAMACTLRVAVPDARMALPEVKALKLIPGYGGTQLLPRLIGEARSLQMLLTGDAVDAAEACRIGLVNMIAEDCVAAAADLAQRASVAGPSTSHLIRRTVAAGLRTDLAAGLALEAEAVRKAAQSPEARAAIDAFAAKGSASLKR